jgi:hypothetical protein
VGKPEGKREQGGPRRRWVDNIKMDTREIGGDGVDCESSNEPTGSIRCWEVLEWLQNWRLLKKGSARRVSKQVNI